MEEQGKRSFHLPYLTILSLTTVIVLAIPLLLLLYLYFSGAGQQQPKPDKIIAQVDEWPISLQEFKRVIYEQKEKDKSLQLTPDQVRASLDKLIEKEVLIKEATRRKLHEREDFIRTIEKFWEQTLIRDLLNIKNHDIVQTTFISQEELKNYYLLKKVRMTFKVLLCPDYPTAQKLRDELGQGKEPAWKDQPGPLTLDRLDLRMAKDLSGLRAGEATITQQGETVYLLQVISREDITLPPLEALREKLEKELAQRKQQREIEQWVQELKEGMKVQINHKLLQEMGGSNGDGGAR